MIYGVGVDLLSRETIPDMCLDLSDPFLQRTFTEGEIRLGLSMEHPSDFFRGRFAAKEAVFKSLGLAQPRWREIEVLSRLTGAPFVTLLGQTAVEAERLGIRSVDVSISWDHGNYLAAAISQREEA